MKMEAWHSTEGHLLKKIKVLSNQMVKNLKEWKNVVEDVDINLFAD